MMSSILDLKILQFLELDQRANIVEVSWEKDVVRKWNIGVKLSDMGLF